MSDARIFNIQRFSLHDGPGARTVVFFKGCNLRCAWCHNPESLSATGQILFYPERCIGCGACFRTCGCHVMNGDVHTIDRAHCTGCGRCADVCYAEALALAGDTMDTSSIMDTILRERPYYGNDGGATFSGGECMCQPNALCDLLTRCRDEGIHTAVDTAGHVPYEQFERVLPLADLFLYDVKFADPALHERYCGTDNVRILDNLRRIATAGARIWLRIPVIGGVNAPDMPGIARIAAEVRPERVELLPYHKLGVGKCEALGMDGTTYAEPTREEMQQYAALFAQHGLFVKQA